MVEALAYARHSGVHVVIRRGGGHCFAGRSSTDGLVLDLSPLNAISVSAGGLATIGAGARLAQVYDVLHRHRLTIPAEVMDWARCWGPRQRTDGLLRLFLDPTHQNVDDSAESRPLYGPSRAGCLAQWANSRLRDTVCGV